MKTFFDNRAFLTRLSPNVDHLNKSIMQRNWAIGVSAVLFLSTVYLAFRNNKIDKELTAIKNPSLAPTSETKTA